MSTPEPEKDNPAYFAPAKPRQPFPTVRSNLPLSAPFMWVNAGWHDLRACGWASLFYGICFTVVGWLLTLAYRVAVELLSGLTVGFLLVGPFLAVGLYALSKQREQGKDQRRGDAHQPERALFAHTHPVDAMEQAAKPPAAKDAHDEFSTHLVDSLRHTSFVIIPLSALIFHFADPLIGSAATISSFKMLSGSSLVGLGVGPDSIKP